MTPQNSDRLCAFILSVVEVRLLTEEPRATAVKKTKTKKQRSAVENFVARFLKCTLFFFFLNIWVTCTQIKVAGFCGMKFYSQQEALTVRTVLMRSSSVAFRRHHKVDSSDESRMSSWWLLLLESLS